MSWNDLRRWLRRNFVFEERSDAPGEQLQQTNGMAAASLTCGIVSVVFAALLGVPVGIIAIITGVKGRRQAERGLGRMTMAGWGLGLGITGIALFFGVWYSYLYAQ
jgi:uncharacterized membrane protein YozB (DUF420 family)